MTGVYRQSDQGGNQACSLCYRPYSMQSDSQQIAMLLLEVKSFSSERYGLYACNQRNRKSATNKANIMETLNLIWEYLQHPLVILIWMHFIADFVLQTDTMAKNKSSSNKWLTLHVSIYSLPFFWFGGAFAVTNAIAHFITDYFTARATSYLWMKEQRHWFFVVIGFDQAIHMTTLFVTYQLLIGF